MVPSTSPSELASFVLIPGAGGAGWLWHGVVDELGRRGRDAVAVDLPADDPTKGLADYADATVAAIGDRERPILVAQSMGGFTAPLVWRRRPVRGVVFLNAMIPLPGETPGAWWDAVGSEEARVAAAERDGYPTAFVAETYFLHDLTPAVAAELGERVRDQSDRPFADACTFDAWPDVPITVVTGRDDRFFPLELQRRVARERLGRDVAVLPGGHLLPLSQPVALAGYLDALAW